MNGGARAFLRTFLYCAMVVVVAAVYLGGYGYLIWRAWFWLGSLIR